MLARELTKRHETLLSGRRSAHPSPSLKKPRTLKRRFGVKGFIFGGPYNKDPTIQTLNPNREVRKHEGSSSHLFAFV